MAEVFSAETRVALKKMQRWKPKPARYDSDGTTLTQNKAFKLHHLVMSPWYFPEMFWRVNRKKCREQRANLKSDTSHVPVSWKSDHGVLLENWEHGTGLS